MKIEERLMNDRFAIFDCDCCIRDKFLFSLSTFKRFVVFGQLSSSETKNHKRKKSQQQPGQMQPATEKKATKTFFVVSPLNLSSNYFSSWYCLHFD